MTTSAQTFRHTRALSFSFRDLLVAFGKFQERRRSLAKLRELDERMLKDIGLTRSQLENAVTYGRHLI